jgi:hypothetical protein
LNLSKKDLLGKAKRTMTEPDSVEKKIEKDTKLDSTTTTFPIPTAIKGVKTQLQSVTPSQKSKDTLFVFTCLLYVHTLKAHGPKILRVA